MLDMWHYPLVICYIAIEHGDLVNGFSQLEHGGSFQFAMWKFTRGYNHHFPMVFLWFSHKTTIFPHFFPTFSGVDFSELRPPWHCLLRGERLTASSTAELRTWGGFFWTANAVCWERCLGYSYGTMAISYGYFYGMIYSINGLISVLITGILGHNCSYETVVSSMGDLQDPHFQNPC